MESLLYQVILQVTSSRCVCLPNFIFCFIFKYFWRSLGWRLNWIGILPSLTRMTCKSSHKWRTNMTKKKKPKQIEQQEKRRDLKKKNANVLSLHGWQSVATFPSAQIFSLSLSLPGRSLFSTVSYLSCLWPVKTSSCFNRQWWTVWSLSNNTVIYYSKQQIVIVIILTYFNDDDLK